jgi:hypothetical protein
VEAIASAPIQICFKAFQAFACWEAPPIMSIVFVLVGLFSGFAYSIYSALSKALPKNRIKE